MTVPPCPVATHEGQCPQGAGHSSAPPGHWRYPALPLSPPLRAPIRPLLTADSAFHRGSFRNVPLVGAPALLSKYGLRPHGMRAVGPVRRDTMKTLVMVSALVLGIVASIPARTEAAAPVLQ